MTTPNFFTSESNFRRQFSQGLTQLLSHDDGLESSILVLANALFDQALYPDLSTPLKQRFSQLYQQRDQYDNPTLLNLVAAEGIQALKTQHRQLDIWELQHNPLRGFRPARAAAQTIDTLSPPPFNPNGFHFNKPFLQKECLWAGELQGRDAHLFYNKFPFVALHGLLVLDAEKQRPQYLQADDHQYIATLIRALSSHIPNLGIAYNSYGAYASVNHLHFQSFIRDALPMSHHQWQHNGGNRAYPTTCLRFDDADKTWSAIEQLHQQNISYNLVYLANCIYLFPRQHQGHHIPADWTMGLAWYELCGGFSCPNAQAMNTLTATQIEHELELLVIT